MSMARGASLRLNYRGRVTDAGSSAAWNMKGFSGLDRGRCCIGNQATIAWRTGSAFAPEFVPHP